MVYSTTVNINLYGVFISTPFLSLLTQHAYSVRPFALAHPSRGEVEAPLAAPPSFTLHPLLESSTTEVLKTIHQLMNLSRRILLTRPARIRKSAGTPRLGLRKIRKQLPEKTLHPLRITRQVPL